MDNNEKQEKIDELVKTFIDGLEELLLLCEDGSKMEYTVKGSMASVVEEFRHPVRSIREQIQETMRKVVTHVTIGIKMLDQGMDIQVKVFKEDGHVKHTILKGEGFSHPHDINEKDIKGDGDGESTRDAMSRIADMIRQKLGESIGDDALGSIMQFGGGDSGKKRKEPNIPKILEDNGLAFLKDKWQDDLPFTLECVQGKYDNTPNGDLLEVLAYLNK